MGKQKRQRQKPHKENPTGIPSLKEFDTEGETLTNENRQRALQRVFGEIMSPNIEEKLSGLQTLQTMSDNRQMAIQIANDGIAKIIGPLLIDHNILVRVASATTLRFIVENGGEAAYKVLLDDDIMTPLCALIREYQNDFQPKLDDKGKDKVECFIQAVTLLWALSENNECVLKVTNEENLIPVLMKYLDIENYGADMCNVVAQCLLILSEDNPSTVQQIRSKTNMFINLLDLNSSENIKLSDTVSLKILAAGLLINVINNTESVAIQTCKVGSVISEVLSIDTKTLINNIVSHFKIEKSSLSTDTKIRIQDFRKILGAQQQALEILANLCSFDEQDGSDDSNTEDSDTAECIEFVDDDPMNENALKFVSTVPVELLEVFNSTDLIQKVWLKTEALEQEILDVLALSPEGRSIKRQAHTIICRAYLCLNNVISSLDVDTLGGTESLYSMWIKIGTVVFKNADPNDIELLESATSAMRAIIQKLAEVGSNTFKNLTVNDIQPMLNGERTCSNANVRANLIRILGNLALILLTDNIQENQIIVQSITEFLLETFGNESELWVMAETLDVIMDMYAEDETDNLARNIELTKKLNFLVPSFKNKVKQQKKNLGDYAPLISTVNANITRFIKYKEKQIRSSR